MLCFAYSVAKVEPEVPMPAGAPLNFGSPSLEAAGPTQRCARCGSALLSQEVADGVLRKLARLDLCGVTGAGSPLLARRRLRPEKLPADN